MTTQFSTLTRSCNHHHFKNVEQHTGHFKTNKQYNDFKFIKEHPADSSPSPGPLTDIHPSIHGWHSKTTMLSLTLPNGDCKIMSLTVCHTELFNVSGQDTQVFVNPGNSVATAIADVFWKNAISMGRKFMKMLEIFDKIDKIKGWRALTAVFIMTQKQICFFWSGTTSLVCFGCQFSAPNSNTLIVSPWLAQPCRQSGITSQCLYTT